jgi:ABC-type dipeptide/oligopeptide/nickel transport system permease component
MDSPGAEYLKFNEKAVIITSDFTDNSMRYFSGEIPLESERIEPLLNVLDQYIKAEVYNDAYPEFMNNSEWQFIIVLVILMMVLISVHQLKFLTKVKFLYYSVPYTIFKGFCNALFVVVFTLFMILSITILPNYFNLEGGNFNYSFYALWRSIILTVRGFFEHGLGMTSTGVPYSEIIIMQGKTTFGLLTIALLIATSVGLTIGMLSSYLKKSHDKQQSMLVILGLSIPETVIIMVMLLSLGPIMSVPFIQANLTTTHFRTIIMPLIVLSLVPTIYVSRTVYMTLVEETKKKYITSLKAKGVKKDRIYTMHLSKVAFNKVMNHFPIILAINISTMIICERMFGLTGLFSTFIDAMISGEFLFCLGIVLSLMVYYYIVVLTSQTLSRVLMPRSGGAYEVE